MLIPRGGIYSTCPLRELCLIIKSDAFQATKSACRARLPIRQESPFHNSDRGQPQIVETGFPIRNPPKMTSLPTQKRKLSNRLAVDAFGNLLPCVEAAPNASVLCRLGSLRIGSYSPRCRDLEAIVIHVHLVSLGTRMLTTAFAAAHRPHPVHDPAWRSRNAAGFRRVQGGRTRFPPRTPRP
jgi:hypothetical protein